ncbi:TetR/AcrR family transcriptional regulator [Novosphingobium resinovorum]|uniref:TetR family transcriptional regulator n=1 Tax=Novosphingobium resinovorum TaxID=158500 RepID=A0A1D8A428_9SPHN|nr:MULTISPECIES: TetR/AcrR family transcriptional regulator [Sphingomonadaceae]AOR76852.1 TetR family transcriptional regulator [Novosphingobium resinovorum]EJU09494.1 TetR family transcriptional regulator [Sphingomonas sp. LH128]MBF7012220.1 TetR/AcrR family transcriptional regulator [Novosphingobium sp. HR1a]WJM26966.1 TetR/AcrR family transcriptional regulator [Novosphingobium resinovorum]
MMEKTGISKREANKARKRAEIVQVASGMFLEQGYAETTMSAIADTVGGSKATLWAHFASKEELFTAVVDLHVEAFARDVEDVLTGQTFSVPALRRACLRFIDCLLRDNSVMLYRLVVSEGERFPEIKETFYTRGPVKLRCAIADFFATRFDVDEAQQLTQLTMSAVTGYRTDVLLRPDPVGQAQHEAFVDNLLSHSVWPPEKDAA